MSSLPGGVDIAKQHLVGIGHSVGGEGMCVCTVFMKNTILKFRLFRVLLQSLRPRIPFQSFILIEATVTENSSLKDRMIQSLINLTCLKTDTWPSLDAARQALSQTPGYKRWDKRELDLFVVCNI